MKNFLGKPLDASIIKEKLPSNVNIAVGQPLNLQAKVASPAPANVQWFKDGIPIKQSDDIKIDKKPDGTVSLKIEQTHPEDTGKYELKVSDSKGESVSSSDVLVGGTKF